MLLTHIYLSLTLSLSHHHHYKKATGTRLGTVLQSIFTIAISCGLALYYEWKLGLVTMCFIPFVLMAMYAQTKILMGQDTVEKKALEKSSKVSFRIT